MILGNHLADKDLEVDVELCVELANLLPVANTVIRLIPVAQLDQHAVFSGASACLNLYCRATLRERHLGLTLQKESVLVRKAGPKPFKGFSSCVAFLLDQAASRFKARPSLVLGTHDAKTARCRHYVAVALCVALDSDRRLAPG